MQWIKLKTLPWLLATGLLVSGGNSGVAHAAWSVSAEPTSVSTAQAGVRSACGTTGTDCANPSAQWRYDPILDMALVGGDSTGSGAFVGVQCDATRARRLVVGAVRRWDRHGFLAALRQATPAMIRLSAEMSGTSAVVIRAIEDRGTLDLPQTADYARGTLKDEQYALIKAAQSLFVPVGKRTYAFPGRGARAALEALSCDRPSARIASRAIPRRSIVPGNATAGEPPRPVQAIWRFGTNTGAEADKRGRYLAFTSITNFPGSQLASFTFELSCHAGRVYALFGNGSVDNAVEGAQGSATKQFMAAVNTPDNVAEVFNGSVRVARFPVEEDRRSGRGHALSRDELAALLDFDTIVVSGGANSVAFGKTGAGQAIVSLAQACGYSRSQ